MRIKEVLFGKWLVYNGCLAQIRYSIMLLRTNSGRSKNLDSPPNWEI